MMMPRTRPLLLSLLILSSCYQLAYAESGHGQLKIEVDEGGDSLYSLLGSFPLSEVFSERTLGAQESFSMKLIGSGTGGNLSCSANISIVFSTIDLASTIGDMMDKDPSVAAIFLKPLGLEDISGIRHIVDGNRILILASGKIYEEANTTEFIAIIYSKDNNFVVNITRRGRYAERVGSRWVLNQTLRYEIFNLTSKFSDVIKTEVILPNRSRVESIAPQPASIERKQKLIARWDSVPPNVAVIYTYSQPSAPTPAAEGWPALNLALLIPLAAAVALGALALSLRMRGPQPPPAQPIVCPNCGQLNRPGARYCRRCGAELLPTQAIPRLPPARTTPQPPPAQGIVCPSCGQLNRPGARYCRRCGAELH